MKEKPLIHNSLIERMFYRIGNDHEVKTYNTLATSSVARATAYASRKIVPVFEALVAGHERVGGSVEVFKRRAIA